MTSKWMYKNNGRYFLSRLYLVLTLATGILNLEFYTTQ